MKTDLFQSCGHCWVLQICWHIECSTFTASSFRIWNSSAGIPSPALFLFIVLLSKAHLTSDSSMSGSRWVIRPLGYLLHCQAGSSPLVPPEKPKVLVAQSCLTLCNPDNHNGVNTHLEPNILECEVKWVLGKITINKASRGDGIPVELFQILKDDAVEVLHSICQQFGKLSSGHRTGKGQFSFQSQRKAKPNNVQTTAQLHSYHTLAK